VRPPSLVGRKDEGNDVAQDAIGELADPVFVLLFLFL